MTEEAGKYEVATMQKGVIINFDEYAMSADKLLKQVQLIQEVMAKVMKRGEHYGVIPGIGKKCKECNGKGCEKCHGEGWIGKPSLYQPGAEKLGTTFRLAPSYQITHSDLPGGHREYEIVCTLIHIPTGQIIGQGVGSCSTMEGKYRFRTGEVETTGKPVPQEYWTDRDQSLIGGKGFSTKKVDGKWEIVRAGEKVEHDNPADYYNTALKMSKKRAHVDSIKTSTACSDIFTQDVEDMPEVIDVKPESIEKVSQEPKPEDTEQPLTDAQLKKIRAMIGDHEELSSTEKKEVYDWLKENKAETVEIKGKQNIIKKSASDLIENFEKYFGEWIEFKSTENQIVGTQPGQAGE